MPEGWEDVDGVEDATEVDQRQKDEGVEGADVIELFCHDGDKRAEGREEGGGSDGDHEHEERVNGKNNFKRQRDDPGDASNHEGAYDSAERVGDGGFCGAERGDEDVDERVIKFGDENGGARVLGGIVDDAHHDEAWDDEGKIGDAGAEVDLFAEGDAENNQIQTGCDDGGENGLHPNREKAADFFGEEGFKSERDHMRGIRRQ